MLALEEARARILAALAPTAAETIALAEAWNRVLASPVLARLTQPPADVSAMDGYAVRAADAVAGARLRVTGAAPAGHPFAGGVGPGEAVRIFTGGFVPAGVIQNGQAVILPHLGGGDRGIVGGLLALAFALFLEALHALAVLVALGVGELLWFG
jgi:hypothetical protein